MAAPISQNFRKMFTSRPITNSRILLCNKCMTRRLSSVGHFVANRHRRQKILSNQYPENHALSTFDKPFLCRKKDEILCSPPLIRLYSTDSGKDIKGAVVYVQNPLLWIKSKWVLFNLHQKYDSTFTIDEFLTGAKQAVCLVTELLSTQRFEQLQGLVYQEVIDWLKERVSSMSKEEREALNLQENNIALVKTRGMELVEKPEKTHLYIDTVCFAMKRSESGEIPYIVDLGFRFCRYYDDDGASDWLICAVTHMHLKELGLR